MDYTGDDVATYEALVRSLADQLDRIEGKDATINIHTNYTQSGSPPSLPSGITPIGQQTTIQMEAAGGPVYAQSAAGGASALSGAYWVGEVGPELFIPSQDGRILSNSDSMALATYSSGGGSADLVTSARNITQPIRELQRSSERLQHSNEKLQRSIDDVTMSATNLVFPFREMAEMYNNTILNGRFDMSLYSDKTTMGRFDMSLYSDDPARARDYIKPIPVDFNDPSKNFHYASYQDYLKQREWEHQPRVVNITINTPVNMADKTWLERELAPVIQRQIREAAR